MSFGGLPLNGLQGFKTVLEHLERIQYDMIFRVFRFHGVSTAGYVFCTNFQMFRMGVRLIRKCVLECFLDVYQRPFIFGNPISDL